MTDTSEQAQKRRDQMFLALSLSDRAELVVGLMDDGRELARAGIRMAHPHYDATEVEHALHRLWVGDDLADKVWPDQKHLRP